MKICFLSIDVEARGEEGSFEGVEKLDRMLDIFKKHKANATLFVTGEVLERFPGLVKNWAKDYEIGCHNYYHNSLDKLDLEAREQQIRDFVDLYQNMLKKRPRGFRAPRNIIDNRQFSILEKYEFLYDSSVFPRYPWWKKRYVGYKGKEPVLPYWLNKKLFEIPESPAAFSIPLVGTWIRGLGVAFYKLLFLFKKPKFISFNMHSWDNVEKKYLKQLDEMLGFLKKIGYEFKKGEEIYEQFSKTK
jgi:peptidoglycan/xylan/chitin deacetylase (PgdA/CDA1 family)